MGLSLIVAIGAQSVYVLRQGIRREHIVLVVAICAISDALLIAAGVAGFGKLVEGSPMFTAMARGVGALYLFLFGLVAAKRAVRANAGGLQADSADKTIAETARRPQEEGHPGEQGEVLLRTSERPVLRHRSAAQDEDQGQGEQEDEPDGADDPQRGVLSGVREGVVVGVAEVGESAERVPGGR